VVAETQESAEALIARSLAVADDESDERWEPVRTLHRRGDRPTFEAADALCRSTDPVQRCLGADILARLGLGEEPFLDERLAVLCELADRETNLNVLYSALSALGHLGDQRALEQLLRHSHHPDRDIRFAVAVALPACLAEGVMSSETAALLRLMEDQDEEVRDWATFGVGTLLEIDGPEIRDALVRRLSDPGADTSGEAVVGLARRKDPRCVEAIDRALVSANVGNLVVEAAAELGDSRFLPALEALDAAGWANDDPRGDWLATAISRCSAPTKD
jgi:HEAT repeat protein